MGWLIHNGRVLASVEIADRAMGRARGLLGRDRVEGALWLQPARSIHTIGMRFPIDVAYCDAELRVLRIATMVPQRVGRPCWAARSVIEAAAGAFELWGVAVGDQLEVSETERPQPQRSESHG